MIVRTSLDISLDLRFPENAKAPPSGPLAFVSCIVILNVEPVSAWRRKDVVPDSGSISAERWLNR
jgi:hypothetical protein